MAPADRDWILSHLPAGGQGRLQALLRELAELGMPRDAALLKQVLSAPVPAREPTLEVEALPLEQAAATPAEAIAAADPARLAAVLCDEPVELVAALLSLRDWTWREALLRHLGPLTARQVAQLQAELGTAIRSGSAGERVLLAALLRRLRELPAGAPPEPGIRALPAPVASRGAAPRRWLGHMFAPFVRSTGR
jgi:hypothetical protein